jgi:hypothetical protein
MNDDDQSLAGTGDDLFPQQSTAESLDQVQRAFFNLIRAVDGQIDFGVFSQGREWNS